MQITRPQTKKEKKKKKKKKVGGSTCSRHEFLKNIEFLKYFLVY